MKSVLIYATVVGIAGAVVSYSLANKLANPSRKIEKGNLK